MLDRFGNEEVVPTGGGGPINPPTPLGPDSQANWDASGVDQFVRVTEAEFNAAMAARAAVQYGVDNTTLANVGTGKGVSGGGSPIGLSQYTFPTTVPKVVTSVPANNYITGLKVRVNSLTAQQHVKGFMSIITMNDTTAYPFSGRKLAADLGHDFISKIGSDNNPQYEWFLVKAPTQKTTTRVASYLYSSQASIMTIGMGANYTQNRQLLALNSMTDSQAGGSLAMFQVYATPTKSW